MTITTDQDMRVRPVATQIRQEPHQNHRIFCSAGAGPRTQVGCHQGVRGPFENEEGEIAMVLIVMIIAGELLLAIRRIIGVIDIQHNGGWRLRVTGTKVIH